jgi:hypothetical protein
LTTVAQLKEDVITQIVCREYQAHSPSKNGLNVGEIRLIYGGRQLDDAESIADLNLCLFVG